MAAKAGATSKQRLPKVVVSHKLPYGFMKLESALSAVIETVCEGAHKDEAHRILKEYDKVVVRAAHKILENERAIEEHLSEIREAQKKMVSDIKEVVTSSTTQPAGTQMPTPDVPSSCAAVSIPKNRPTSTSTCQYSRRQKRRKVDVGDADHHGDAAIVGGGAGTSGEGREAAAGGGDGRVDATTARVGDGSRDGDSRGAGTAGQGKGAAGGDCDGKGDVAAGDEGAGSLRIKQPNFWKRILSELSQVILI